MSDEITAEEIQNKAAEPKKIKVDGEEVENRTVDEIIKADKYAMSKKTAANRSLGVRFAKFSFPGSV